MEVKVDSDRAATVGRAANTVVQIAGRGRRGRRLAALDALEEQVCFATVQMPVADGRRDGVVGVLVGQIVAAHVGATLDQVLVELEARRAQNVVHDAARDYDLHEEDERGRLGRALVGEYVAHTHEGGAHVAEDDLRGHEASNRGNQISMWQNKKNRFKLFQLLISKIKNLNFS